MREIVAPVKPVLLITSAVASINTSRTVFPVFERISSGWTSGGGPELGVAERYALRKFDSKILKPGLVVVISERNTAPIAVEAPSATPAHSSGVLAFLSPNSCSQFVTWGMTISPTVSLRRATIRNSTPRRNICDGLSICAAVLLFNSVVCSDVMYETVS